MHNFWAKIWAPGPKNKFFEKIKKITPKYLLNLQVYQISKDFHNFY